MVLYMSDKVRHIYKLTATLRRRYTTKDILTKFELKNLKHGELATIILRQIRTVKYLDKLKFMKMVKN